MDTDDLIGTPFAIGGRGPDAFDCYGLVREIYRREKNSVIPEYVTYNSQGENQALIATFAQNDWAKTERKPGVAVVFWIGRFASHIGYVLADGQRFIHAWESSGGVTIERLSDWEHRIAGFYDYRR
jgi:cell wall-associated NlpC family hydrolase